MQVSVILSDGLLNLGFVPGKHLLFPLNQLGLGDGGQGRMMKGMGWNSLALWGYARLFSFVLLIHPSFQPPVVPIF